MTLTRLQVERFRNLHAATVALAPGLNLIHGTNGSGKTSLLEACYFLSAARSFRGMGIEPIIQRGTDDCLVVGTLRHQGQTHQVGIQRTREGQRRIRLDGENVHRASELARLLPTLVLGPETIDLLLGPPDNRRRFLNWGLFHVEPAFLNLWEEANRCLKQRNQLLRSGAWDRTEMQTWTAQLARQAEQIDRYRAQYMQQFSRVFSDVLGQLSEIQAAELRYFRGWPQDQQLPEIYAQELPQDEKRGYTQKGFQRADVRIVIGGQPAVKVCSRGELKVLVWAMMLAQGAMQTSQDILYLVDDLASEFDAGHRQRVCRFLRQSGHQVLMTGVEPEVLKTASENSFDRMFHVKQGEIQEI